MDYHLSYKKIGNGDKILFAFHGFGQNKNCFDNWKQKVGSTHTIYAFDLFYHGESIREPGKLTKKQWETYLNEIIEKEQIRSFSVLGYSLGGRFAITTALSFSSKIEHLFLVAPDGIFLTVWFKLATTPVIRYLFKYMMEHPDKLERLIRFNENIRVVSKYVADFVRKEMGTEENRKRVYLSWNHFKHLGYSRRQLIQLFRENSFARTIILGKKDHIIPPKKIIPIIDKMSGFNIEVITGKHHQLIGLETAALTMKYLTPKQD